jgi:hypothetical protein
MPMVFARLPLVVVLFVALAGSAQAQNVTAPLTGAQVVSNGAVVDLYMSANWDAIPQVTSNGITKEQLDAWVGALVNSGFLAAASSEYGIGTPIFVGGFNSNAACTVPPASKTVGRTTMYNFVNCNLGKAPIAGLTGSRNVLAILFTDPNMTVAGPLGEAPCPPSTPNGWSGYHTSTQFFPFVFTAYAVIPTNPACQGTPLFLQVTNTVSHELVEGLTDPNCPLGWAQNFGPGNINVTHTCKSGEVADKCTSVGDNPAPNSDFFPYLLNGTVELYWDNSAEACGPAWAPLPNAPPSPTVSGMSTSTDATNLNLTISGSGFGSLPGGAGVGPITLPFSGTIPYFLYVDTQNSTHVGNVLDGDAIGAAYNTWSDGGITLGIPLSSGMASCDPFTVQIWNPANGGTVTFPWVVPGVIQLLLFTPNGVSLVSEQSFELAVSVNPSSLVTPASFTLTYAGQSSTLNESGSFTWPLEAQVGANTVTVSTTNCSGAPVTGSTQMIVYPVINSITPNHGVAGTAVTIQGHGLSGPSALDFGGVPANFSSSSDTQIDAIAPSPAPAPTNGVTTTPAGVGVVPVAVTNGGLTSYDSALPSFYSSNFYYDQPNVPVFLPIVNCQKGNVELYVSAWGTNGSPDANSAITYSVNGGSVSPNNHALDQNGEDVETLKGAGSAGTTTLTASINAQSPASFTINWVEACPPPISSVVLHAGVGSNLVLLGNGPVATVVGLGDVALSDGGGIFDLYLFDASSPQNSLLIANVQMTTSALRVETNAILTAPAVRLLRSSSAMVRIVPVGKHASPRVQSIEFSAVRKP